VQREQLSATSNKCKDNNVQAKNQRRALKLVHDIHREVIITAMCSRVLLDLAPLKQGPFHH